MENDNWKTPWQLKPQSRAEIPVGAGIVRVSAPAAMFWRQSMIDANMMEKGRQALKIFEKRYSDPDTARYCTEWAMSLAEDDRSSQKLEDWLAKMLEPEDAEAVMKLLGPNAETK